MTIPEIINYCGTFVFALTGALKARTYHMDIFGAAVLAFVTAYGGGTTRDILLGIHPLGWMNDYLAMGLVIGAVGITLLSKHNIAQLKRTIFITDAIGLGMFTAAGIEKSLLHGVNGGYAIVMGAISATFGGLIADILSNTIPDLLKRGELYATVCLLGGIIYILLLHLGVAEYTNVFITVALVVAMRIISKWKRLTLPEI